MDKKIQVVKIISCIVVGIAVIAALLWFVPRSTRVDHTLSASKFDHHGDLVRTTEIRISGRKLDYLFQDSRVEFTITPFDGLAWIEPVLYANTNQEGHLSTAPENDILYTFYYGFPTNPPVYNDSMTQFRLGFSPDMDRWIIINDSDKVYYVASVSGNYSPQELVEYFRVLIPVNWTTDADTPASTLNYSLHGRWVNRNGTVQDQRPGVDFSVSGTLLTEFEPYSTVELALNFTWPDCSIEQDDNKSTYTGHAQFADKHDNQRLYHIGAWLYDPAKHDSTSISFTICPEEGFVVVKLGQDYLVASTEPNANPTEIFAFYKEYVHVSE